MVHNIKTYLKEEANSTPAFVRAIEAMSEGDTLMLDGGEYHFYPDGALVKEYYISNNDCGIKPIAFPILNKKGIVIDGGGAELIFHGGILPFVMDGSEDITVKNLSVDYASPFYAQAKIVEASDEGILLEFDGKDFSCRINEGKYCFYSKQDGWKYEVDDSLVLEFDGCGYPSAFSPAYFAYIGDCRDHGFLEGMYRYLTPEERGENRIFLRGNVGELHTAGNYLVMTYSHRDFPGFFITDSKRISIENVNLYHTAAMGVIAQTSENITLEGVIAEPREGSGRVLSTNADATHFVNCRGKITIRNSKLVQTMDDSCNIHGIYNLYREKREDGYMSLGFGHFQQKGVLIYKKGDTVCIIDSETNEIKAKGRVLDAYLSSPDEVRLKLDCDVPTPGAHYVTENVTAVPEVHIYDTVSGYNRPRGFLISSPARVLIERCKFSNMQSGIQLSGEMCDWYESGAVRDVTIRDCDFYNSAYACGPAILCKPRLRCTNTVFNGRVVIENNKFTQAQKRICDLTSCDEFVFRGNSFKADPTLPNHKAISENGITVGICNKAEIEELKIL